MYNFSADSNQGKVRQVNEDIFAVREDLGLIILADGMGGRNSGRLAASIAVETVLHQLQTIPIADISPDHLLIAVEEANRRVLAKSREHIRHQGMGTTLIIAVMHDNKVIFCHVGDSRGYILRDGNLKQVTVDHSIVQTLVDAGKISPEEALHAPNRNIITRSIGTEKTVLPDISEHSLSDNDILLLCSDGLSDLVMHDHLADILAANTRDLLVATDQLISAANDAGGTDNITAILIQN